MRRDAARDRQLLVNGGRTVESDLRYMDKLGYRSLRHCRRFNPGSSAQTTHDNTISQNTIHDIGAEYRDSVGVLATYTTHSVIDHNTIHDLPYSGISVGRGWVLPDQQPQTGESTKHAGIYENHYLPEYTTPTVSKDNQLTNNLIYHAMLTGDDGAGIYTLGAQEGTTISGNYIHTMPSGANRPSTSTKEPPTPTGLATSPTTQSTS